MTTEGNGAMLSVNVDRRLPLLIGFRCALQQMTKRLVPRETS